MLRPEASQSLLADTTCATTMRSARAVNSARSRAWTSEPAASDGTSTAARPRATLRKKLMATRVALGRRPYRELLVNPAQRRLASAGRGKLLGRQATATFHHGEQIMESLQPTIVHVTIAKPPREHVRVGCQSCQVGRFDGAKLLKF